MADRNTGAMDKPLTFLEAQAALAAASWHFAADVMKSLRFGSVAATCERRSTERDADRLRLRREATDGS